MRRTPEGMTRRDTNNIVFKRNVKAELIEEALELLKQVGWIESQMEKTGGRVAERLYAA